MSIFIAYPDGRIGREAGNSFVERFGYVPDIENRNRFQKQGPYKFMITKARDALQAVEQGCDIGLTGQDFFEEYVSNRNLIIVEKLPVCKSRLVLFGRPDRRRNVVVTTYPEIAYRYLNKNVRPIDAPEIISVTGETESWVASGFADLGIDIVETGKTLEETGLVIKDVIMESSVVIIARKDNIDRVNALYKEACDRKALINKPVEEYKGGMGHRFTDGG